MLGLLATLKKDGPVTVTPRKIAGIPDQEFVGKSESKTPPARLLEGGVPRVGMGPGERMDGPRDPLGARALTRGRDQSAINAIERSWAAIALPSSR
jgi:hypothetical protein